MGTSSARQGPTGRLWRLAKGAATRYLSPEGAGAVTAQEVAARYIAALGEGGEPVATALAAFRLTRRVAQNLGAFGSRADSQGWSAALNAWGLKGPAGEDPVLLAQSLSAALVVSGGGLEQAVAQTALVRVLLPRPEPGLPASPPEAARSVQRFLAEAFYGRLALDLGESLEAAAPGFSPLRQGLSAIAACIGRAAETAGLPAPAPLSPEHWLGLPGWTWVTGSLAGLMSELNGTTG